MKYLETLVSLTHNNKTTVMDKTNPQKVKPTKHQLKTFDKYQELIKKDSRTLKEERELFMLVLCNI